MGSRRWNELPAQFQSGVSPSKSMSMRQLIFLTIGTYLLMQWGSSVSDIFGSPIVIGSSYAFIGLAIFSFVKSHFFTRTLKKSTWTREVTKKDRKIPPVDELISETRRKDVFVTPPIKATKVMSKSMRDRNNRGLDTISPVITPGSNKSGSVGNLTPEQLQNLLREFDESADGIAGAYGQQKLTPDRPFESSLSSTRTIYRPSAVEKGTSSTPLRADGRPTQSPLSQRHRVMHNLGITESALEESIEKLREWFADNVIHSLQKKLATAHIDVIQSAERLGVSGIPLTPLKDFSNDLSSQIADDESTLSELKTRVQDYLRHYTNSQNQDLVTCLNSIHAYQQLKLLLVGKYPSGFLQSPQNGYILKRLSDLSKGTCLMDFEWNKGGGFNRRSWSTELPTDSALLLYLFAAYIIAPNWNFTDEDPNRLEGSGGVLYVAQVPPRSVSDYFAVLTTRPPPGSRGNAVLALQLTTDEPYFSLLLNGETMLTETGQYSLFIILALFLFHCDSVGGTLGGRSLQSLELGPVVKSPRRLTLTMLGKSLFGY